MQVKALRPRSVNRRRGRTRLSGADGAEAPVAVRADPDGPARNAQGSDRPQRAEHAAGLAGYGRRSRGARPAAE